MAPTAASAIGEARDLLERRLRELDNERRQVERALAQLRDVRRARRRRGRPRGPATRRRRRGPNRADQALAAVKSSPGITASEIAKKLGIKPNYVYRLMADLTKAGKVRKKGRSYEPA